MSLPASAPRSADRLHRLVVAPAPPAAASIMLAMGALRAFGALSALGALGALGGCAIREPHATFPVMPRAVPAPVPAAPAAPAPAPASDILASQARAMLGQPYRYGGAAPGGFDCSGLVQYAAHAAGLVVPRTAEEQLKLGMPIARAQLARGDLVFLHLQGKELHVGIALDDSRFIHAPSSGGRVRIDSLEVMPYARGFFAARRIAAAPR